MRALPLLSLTLLLPTLACDDSSGDDTPAADAASAIDAASGGADAATPTPDAAPTADAGATTMSTWSAGDGVTPDAVCPVWTLINNAMPEVPTLTGGQLGVATDVDNENMFYIQTDLMTPATLVVEGRVRLVSGSTSTPSRGPTSLGFRIGPDLKKNALTIADGEIFLLADENVKGPAVAQATTDAPHTYRLEVNTTTGVIQVFVDGGATPVLTGMTFPEPAVGAAPAINFGEATLFARGSSLWESVSHNAHSPIFCP